MTILRAFFRWIIRRGAPGSTARTVMKHYKLFLTQNGDDIDKFVRRFLTNRVGAPPWKTIGDQLMSHVAKGTSRVKIPDLNVWYS